MRNYFKIGVLLLGVLSFTTNCDNDDEIYNPDEDVINAINLLKGIKKNDITLEEVEQDYSASHILEKSLLKRKQKLSAKGEYSNEALSSLSDLDLSDKVTKYSLNDYTSYTIPIKKIDGKIDSFQSVVIEENNLREAVYIFTYFPDKDYQESIKLGYLTENSDIEFSGNYSIECLYYKEKSKDNINYAGKGTTESDDDDDLNENAIDCIVIHNPGRNCTAGGNHSVGQPCQGTPSQHAVPPSVDIYCFGFGGDGAVTDYADTESDNCSDCDAEGGGNLGSSFGGNNIEPYGSEPWIPEYICVETDIYTGECIRTEPNIPIISSPEDSFYFDGNDVEINENTWTEDTVLFQNVSDPEITDIDDYLKCFDLTSGATITIYVDQPVANSSDTWVDADPSILSIDPDVGHTYISITQNGVTRTLGYYPTPNTINPAIGNNSSNSVIRNNEGHSYDVSISTNVSSSQLSNIIDGVSNYNSTYHLNTNNCTDFGITIGNMAGLGLPDTYGSWPFGGGSNPGNLGQDIRGMNSVNGSTISTSSGNTQINSGSC